MFLSTVGKYIGLTLEMTKSSILSAMEYRVTFLIQVLGMIVNDIALASVWVIFFQKFTSIKGWGFSDSVLLYAITTINFGAMMIVARGAFEMARTISRGELDYFLALPKNILWHISVSKTEISAIGDFIFGLAIFLIAGNPTLERTGLLIFYSVITTISLVSFTIIVQSVAFWVGNFEEAAGQIFHLLIGFTLYPQTIFSGVLKVIMLTIIPAFFIATLPVQLIKSFDLGWTMVLVLYSIGISILAVLVFNTGLKRYESGNLINTRV